MTFRVVWSNEDDEYVGLCDEFPSLSWLAPTVNEASDGIRLLVREANDDGTRHDLDDVIAELGIEIEDA